MEILIYFCGMRRPSLGQNSGDLSRLTSASSDTDSSNNTATATSHSIINKNLSKLSPGILIDLLETSEWMKSSRKRKERQDSTSSLTQDRKLVRSNSEEYISNNLDYDGLRRVSSHEDFKKRTINSAINVDNNDINQNNENKVPNLIVNEIINIVSPINEEIKEKTINHTPTYRLSPIRDIKQKNEDIDVGVHEKQRQNERFLKIRPTPGRKSISPRKSKHSSGIKIIKDKEENCYKYDISALKYERRGFISSKFKYEENVQEEENEGSKIIIPSEESSDISDYNDNTTNQENENDVLPWSKSFQIDSPIVCPRFAENTYDHVNNSQEKDGKFFYHSMIPVSKDVKSFRSGENSINLETSKIIRDTIKKPASYYLPTDEKIKQINKRLVVLKKRYSQYEDKFENSYGHKPSQMDKSSDKVIKNLVSEMNKLRKEKHHLRSEPRQYIHRNNNNNNNINIKDNENAIDEENKITKMKETLGEIEKRLQKKRSEERRLVDLESLTPDELIKEKTSVQKGLLYFESIFGRPVTREERDTARPLYDRYRTIKRLVNRNAMISGSGISVPELPTILEHEAMAFTTTSSNERTSFSSVSVGESPSDTSESIQSTDSTDTSSSMNENVHTMSIQELWTHFDATREETKNLKKTIKEFEDIFEERNGRKMLKTDRKLIEETYTLYKQKKAKVRLLDALIKKHMSSF